MSHQRQRFKEVDKQAMAELQYVVFTDLQNFIGILVEAYAVAQLVDRNDLLYLIHMNRLITQVNLSKCIHFDTQQTSQNKFGKELKDLKSKCLNVLNEFVSSKIVDKNPDLEQSLEDYQNVLCKSITNLQMKELHQVPIQKSNIDQKLIQDLIGSVSQVDDEYDQIRSGRASFNFDEKQLYERTQFRYQQAIKKIQIYKDCQNNVKQQTNYDDQHTQALEYQEAQNTLPSQQQHQFNQQQNIVNQQQLMIELIIRDQPKYLSQETISILQLYFLESLNQLDPNSQEKLQNLINWVRQNKQSNVNTELRKLSEHYGSQELNLIIDKIYHLINPQYVSQQRTKQFDSNAERNRQGRDQCFYK